MPPSSRKLRGDVECALPMIAVDTNVVIRLLVNDDAAQARKAHSLFASAEDLFVSPSVLLECEWVLRAAYGFVPAQIASFLRALLGLPGVKTAPSNHVARALAGYESGMDWADALHLALGHEAERFCTFDAAFRRQAARAMPGTRVEAP